MENSKKLLSCTNLVLQQTLIITDQYQYYLHYLKFFREQYTPK